MIIRCQSCNAALEVEEGVKFVDCQYCKSTNRVVPPSIEQKAVQRGGYPDAGQSIAGKKRAGKVILGIIVALAMGIGLWFFSGGWRMVQEWYSTACLVDFDGDNVLDVAGFMGTPGGEGKDLVVLSGTEGDKLWSSPGSYKTEDKVLCLSLHHIGIAKKNFELDLFHMKKPNSPKRFTLPNEVRHYSRDADGKTPCVSLEMNRSTRVGIDLKKMTQGECDSDPVHQARERSLSKNKSLRYTASKGKLNPDPNGNLFYFSDYTHPDINMLWVVPAGSKSSSLIGYEPKSGTIRYRFDKSSHWTTSAASSPKYNGRFVITRWGMGVHAYDPKTGGRAWHVGGR